MARSLRQDVWTSLAFDLDRPPHQSLPLGGAQHAARSMAFDGRPQVARSGSDLCVRSPDASDTHPAVLDVVEILAGEKHPATGAEESAPASTKDRVKVTCPLILGARQKIRA
jgi:hypothetical protein